MTRTHFAAALGLLLGACHAHQAAAPTGAATPAAATPAATPATAAAAADTTPPTLRLDDRARPLRYRVELTVVPTEERFHGALELDVELRAATRVLWLEAARLDVSRITVGGVAAEKLPGGSDFIGVRFPRPLGPGPVTVHFDYTGEITAKASDGLFRQQEGDRWYAFTHFEPIDARRVFPCFDEPAYKTPWELRLKVRQEDHAVANAPVLREEPLPDGFKRVVFAPTRPLPSYLVALAVGPFDFVDGGVAGRNRTPVRIITPRGRGDEARFAAQVTGTLLTRLESYFDIAYPYEKLDIIDVPVSNGAMENPGLITYLQRGLLAKPADETLKFRRSFTSVATHELAHQWFGDLVTTAWWDDIWLNEAFASWMANHELAQYEPDWHVEVSHTRDGQAAMFVDGLASARRIRQPIRANDDMVNAFDDITYKKGEAVIAMFERWVGPERFRAGIHRYLEQHAFGAATSDQFLAAIDAAATQPVSAAFRSFLDQPGVPLVSIGLECKAGAPPRLTLAQTRQRPAGTVAGAAQTWQLPLCVRYLAGGVEGRACTLLTTPSGELPLPDAHGCPSFVAGNDGQRGYYRTRYVGSLWTALVAGVERLGLAERAGLLGDAAALVRSGELPVAEALALAGRFAGEHNQEVVASALELVGQARQLELVTPALEPRYAHFVRATFGARAHQLGFRPRAGEDEDTRLARPRLLFFVADEGQDEELRRQGHALALAWLADHKAVDPELVGAVLATAALEGDRALFDRYVAEARKPTTTRNDRARLLAGLARFQRPELAQAAAALMIDPAIDARESHLIAHDQLSVPALRPIAYDFVKAHFDALANRLSPRLAATWGAVVGFTCDEAHARDGEQFFAGRSTRFVGGPRILAQAVEAARVCAAAHALQLDSAAAFLRRF